MQLHYCMGKLVEAGVWRKSKGDKCSSCGMKKEAGKKKNCCRDEHKKVSQENDQKLAEQAYTEFQSLTAAIPVQWAFQPTENPGGIAVSYPVSHAPPRGVYIPIYLLNSHFRI